MRQPGEIKREPRVDTQFQARLLDSSGNEHAVTILDLSKSGFRLRCDEMLRIGEKIRLQTDRHGDFPAQIRWALGEEAGGLFLSPVKVPD
ncbi:PilZ domain-containing protein [Sphingomonas rhizophila]|uniref:PilZ domain-containing protein n=1 Tax=Sphingomonas rhizophila TaxID=2071607 RepID=A0A7G9S9B4_9SPHN|nr:PilZ domain-containing protein [Sphingomonas rhizophila]QNN64439.1 PilZ domain-containing protein [Sphingomonas rhizophila]